MAFVRIALISWLAVLAACEADPVPQAATIAPEESPKVSLEVSPTPGLREPITGFKFLRLGMTLEELLRLPRTEIDVDRHVNCIEDDRATLCAVLGQTFAGADAQMQAHFFATESVPPAELVPIPPIHEISSQEIRMGRAEYESATRERSIEVRRKANAENRDRQLRRKAAFRLTSIVVRMSLGEDARVLQALTDRYGTPEHFQEISTHQWQSHDAHLLFYNSLGMAQATYMYEPLQPAFDGYHEDLRRRRAADL